MKLLYLLHFTLSELPFFHLPFYTLYPNSQTCVHGQYPPTTHTRMQTRACKHIKTHVITFWKEIMPKREQISSAAKQPMPWYVPPAQRARDEIWTHNIRSSKYLWQPLYRCDKDAALKCKKWVKRKKHYMRQPSGNRQMIGHATHSSTAYYLKINFTS